MFCLRSSLPGLTHATSALNVSLAATSAAKPSAIKTNYGLVPSPPKLAPSNSFTGLDRGPLSGATLSGSNFVRLSHTDIPPPQYSDWDRHPNWRNQTDREERNASNQLPSYVVLGTGTGLVLYLAKYTLTGLAYLIGPARDKLAAAAIEIDLATIPEGKNITLKWRGKPLFIRHRTPEEIAAVKAQDLAELRDPEDDAIRCTNEKFLIVIGICTHLGCVPIAHAGEWNGYYCPCHGSHYDNSGRIMKGPAPLNLEVPDYEYLNDTTVVVGKIG